MPFFDIFAFPRWWPLRMRTKVASFFIFFQELSNKKKIKALRPKMTKIASRGGGGPALIFSHTAICLVSTQDLLLLNWPESNSLNSNQFMQAHKLLFAQTIFNSTVSLRVGCGSLQNKKIIIVSHETFPLGKTIPLLDHHFKPSGRCIGLGGGGGQRSEWGTSCPKPHFWSQIKPCVIFLTKLGRTSTFSHQFHSSCAWTHVFPRGVATCTQHEIGFPAAIGAVEEQVVPPYWVVRERDQCPGPDVLSVSLTGRPRFEPAFFTCAGVDRVPVLISCVERSTIKLMKAPSLKVVEPALNQRQVSWPDRKMVVRWNLVPFTGQAVRAKLTSVVLRKVKPTQKRKCRVFSNIYEGYKPCHVSWNEGSSHCRSPGPRLAVWQFRSAFICPPHQLCQWGPPCETVIQELLKNVHWVMTSFWSNVYISRKREIPRSSLKTSSKSTKFIFASDCIQCVTRTVQPIDTC